MFYQELEEDAIAVKHVARDVFQWSHSLTLFDDLTASPSRGTVCHDLTAGRFEKAKAVVLLHPVLSMNKEAASQQQFLQVRALFTVEQTVMRQMMISVLLRLSVCWNWWMSSRRVRS